MLDSKAVLKVEPSSETFSHWINQDFISEDLRYELVNKNLLLIPCKGHADNTEALYFPNGTEEFFDFLKQAQTEDFKVDICIEEHEFAELALHFDVMTVTHFIVSNLAFPTAAELLAEYIKERLRSRLSKTELHVDFTVVMDEQNNRSLRFSYRGPASEYRATIQSTVQSLNDMPASSFENQPSTTGKLAEKNRKSSKRNRTKS